jgi:hypothetical protein
MPQLHIEHAITDYATWKSAFDRFEPARAAAGVQAHRIARPVDDDAYIIVVLDFADVAAAAGFLSFLRTNVWPSRATSPGLAGEPQTRILTELETATTRTTVVPA